ncbi:MAG: DUF928 domain-containing protein [Richelia sp. SM2_1_7]|nr:DUF928 domain-containing protein [Richelia sp. SM2_1_7]
MKLIWLSVKLSLVLGFCSTILIGNQGFAQNKQVKFQLPAPPPGKPVGGRSDGGGKRRRPRPPRGGGRRGLAFKLPAPPPGKPVGGRTRGGGRRGPCPEVQTNLTALIPFTQKTLNLGQTTYVKENVWGLTNSLRPTFYFYVPFSNEYSFPTEFLLQDEESKQLVYQSVVKLPSKPGIISVSLPESVKPLKENRNYRLFFNIYCETQKPIPSLRVEGVVRRVELNDELTEKINAATPRERVELYAGEGIWFDSLDNLANLRKQQPKNQELLENWTSLLESTGFKDITEQPLVE